MAQHEPSGKGSSLSLITPHNQPGLNLPDWGLFCILVPLFPKDRADLLLKQESLELLLIPCSPTYSVLFALSALPDRIQAHTWTSRSCKAFTPTCKSLGLQREMLLPSVHLHPHKDCGWSQMSRTHQNEEPAFRNILTSCKICPPGDAGSQM